MTPEKSIQNEVIKFLKKLKEEHEEFDYQRRQAEGIGYKVGIPDLYAIYKGVHIEIEVKKPGGERSSMQDKWKVKCKKMKTPYFCVDNVDEFIQQFEYLLSKIDFISNYIKNIKI